MKSFCNGCKHWEYIQACENNGHGFHFCNLFDRYELKWRKLWCNGKLKEEETMTTEEIRQTFDEVQMKLDTLQNEKATFLFIANEGNHFTMGGNKYMIAAQMAFAMMRYPVVRDIIKQCAANYDELNAAFGKEARDKIMDHQIEQNSGR